MLVTSGIYLPKENITFPTLFLVLVSVLGFLLLLALCVLFFVGCFRFGFFVFERGEWVGNRGGLWGMLSFLIVFVCVFEGYFVCVCS